MAIYEMRNPIQPYDWGSTNAIATIQRRSNDGAGPEAELWMGSHPRAPSSVRLGNGEWIELSRLLGGHGRSMIGGFATQLLPPGESRPSLPFLVKILAAARALSIQAHPDRGQARQGFEREESSSVPFDAAERNYRDRNHKPELMCALETFYGLRGFRALDDLAGEISGLLKHPVPDDGLKPLAQHLSEFVAAPTSESWRSAFTALVSASHRRPCRAHLVAWGMAYAARVATAGDDAYEDRYWWVGELSRQFPGDPGALAPLYLNLFRLEPFQAIFLGPRMLHAYLRGTGVEIMASSDNVLRAGCTTKHVDPAELVRVIDFDGTTATPIDGRTDSSPRWRVYRTVAKEFELAIAGVDEPDVPELFTLAKRGGPAIVLALDGSVRVRGDRSELTVEPGRSVLVDHQTERFDVARAAGARAVVAAVSGALDI